jgi:hypothetical protein
MKINEIITETFTDSNVRSMPGSGRGSWSSSGEYTWGKHPTKGWVTKDPSGNVVFISKNTNQYQAIEEVKAKADELNSANISEAREDRPMPATNLKVGDKVTADTSKEDYPGGHKSRSGTVTRVGQTGVHIKPDDGGEIEYHPYKIVKISEEGVGIITKQNSTCDVNKSTPRKNLKAFNLVK